MQKSTCCQCCTRPKPNGVFLFWVKSTNELAYSYGCNTNSVKFLPTVHKPEKISSALPTSYSIHSIAQRLYFTVNIKKATKQFADCFNSNFPLNLNLNVPKQRSFLWILGRRKSLSIRFRQTRIDHCRLQLHSVLNHAVIEGLGPPYRLGRPRGTAGGKRAAASGQQSKGRAGSKWANIMG